MADDLDHAARMTKLASKAIRVVEFGMRLKARMLDRGIRAARIRCPEHPDTFVHARLAGPRNHIHMACEVRDCSYRMME